MRIPLSLCLIVVFLFAGVLRAEEFGDGSDQLSEMQARLDAITHNCARELLEELDDEYARGVAAFAIGIFYSTRAMGEDNAPRAAEFFGIAHELGIADATAALGRMHVSGAPGVTQPDILKAISYYEQAVAGGSVVGMVQLGDIYARGIGGAKRDSKRALDLYLKAAAREDADAMERIRPVMRKAAEWEAENPGKKAGFPTKPEDVVNPSLSYQYDEHLKKIGPALSEVEKELNIRINDRFAGKNAR